MVKKVWLRKKLKRLSQKRKWLRNMENKDVQVFVTGVSMAGEVNLDEHNRTPEDNKEESEREEISDS
jgi:hypothetical protein